MTTKIRNTSAALADRVSEVVEAALPDRKQLAAALAAAQKDDTEEAERLRAEVAAAEVAVAAHEYTRLIARQNAARYRVTQHSCTPRMRTSAAERALREALTPDEQEAILHLDRDLERDRNVLTGGTYRNDSQKGLAQSAAATARFKDLCAPHGCEVAADVFAAVREYRKRLDVRESPTAAAGGWEG